MTFATSICESNPEIKISPSDLVTKTESIDQDCRPLIMWLLADTMSEENSLLNTESILRSHIKKQRVKHWEPNHITGHDEINTACITMLGGIHMDLDKLPSQSAQEFCQDINKTAHQIIIGRLCDSEKLNPYEPDMIGELHALDTINGTNELDTKSMQQVFQNAVDIDGGSGLIGFLFRAANNYPSHDAFTKLQHSNMSSYWYGKLVHMIVLGLNKPNRNKSHKRIWKLIEGLQQKINNTPDNFKPTLIDALSACCVNASFGFDERKFFERSGILIGNLKDIVLANNSVELFVRHAKAQKNILGHYECSSYTDDDRVTIVIAWLELFKIASYPLEAKSQLIQFVSTEFHNATNKNKFETGSISRDWISILEKAVSLIKDKKEVEHHISNTLVSVFQTLDSNGHTINAQDVFKTILANVEYMSEMQLGTLGTVFFNQTLSLKNGGDGNLYSYNCLSKLAKVNEHSKLLLQNAFDPNEK